MKVRIISGAVFVVLVAAVIFTTLYFNLPLVLTLFLMLLSAVGVYEMLHNTGITYNKALLTGAVIYSVIVQLFYAYFTKYILILSVIYGVFSLIICFYKKLTYKRMIMVAIMPVMISYCFSCIGEILSLGLMHLILLLNFSCVCDCGAYFVGVTLGRHKLCPKISPKKTVEGAIGGILLSTGLIQLYKSVCRI